MPSGRTHDRITLWSLPVAAGLTYLLTRSSSLTLVLAAGYLFSGLMLGPDLDTRSVQFNRWGWFRWIWIPYRGSMRHRSPFSHAPITGTLLRVIYLLIWLAIAIFTSLTIANEIAQLGWTWGEIGQVMAQSLQQHQWHWLALAIGLELGALSHYTSDWGVSTYKQVKKKGWSALWSSLWPSSTKRRSTRQKSRAQPRDRTPSRRAHAKTRKRE